MKTLLITILAIGILHNNLLKAQDFTGTEKEFIKQKTISFERPIGDITISDFNKLNFNDEIKVFGLGEANHGTREFQILKLKLAIYLINEKGLNNIIFEFPYSQGLLIDDYVKGKNEDGLAILINQKNSPYKNTDFIEFIESIKKLNNSKGENDKVSFLGADIFGKPTSIKLLRDFFVKVDTMQLALFNNYQQLESNTYLSTIEQDNKVFKKLGKKIHRTLKQNNKTYIQKSSFTDYNQSLRLAESLQLNWKGHTRPNSFAQNVLKILSENPNNKILLLSHNLHVGMSKNEVGWLLKKKLKEKYFSIGTDYEEGTFSLWNLKDPNHRFVDTLYTPKFENGFADKLTCIPGSFHFISLGEIRNIKEGWRDDYNYIASVGMGFSNDLSPKDFRKKVILNRYFDALFVFKKINPINRFE